PPDASRSQRVERTCTPRIHGISQDIPSLGLNEKGGMTDEGDDGGGAVQDWRLLRRVVKITWPPPPRFDQHPRDRRERLSTSASGVDESLAIKVIALLPGHCCSGTGGARLR